MKNTRTIWCALLCTLGILSPSAKAQVQITGAMIQPANITPQGMTLVNIQNSGTAKNVILEADLYNTGNEKLLHITSLPFEIKPGLNASNQTKIFLSVTEYGSSNQAAYLRTHHMLPSGAFKYCAKLTEQNGEGMDEYCQDVESINTSFLMLVSPYDKDTVDTKNPLLMWNHSESFNLLAQGEYFRMIVVELNDEQGADAGVTANIPLIMKDYLSTHQLQYPLDAPKLQDGKRYGWQVLKMSNGMVIQKTEAWEFRLRDIPTTMEYKYAVMKRNLDGGFHTVEGGMLYFRYEENYVGGELDAKIYNSKREVIQPEANVDLKGEENSNKEGVKRTGDNRFGINLDLYNLKQGFYTLETKNAKGQIYKLKFYVK